jgi:hypothetical protein
MHIHARPHALRVWPELPALRPPPLTEVWAGGPQDWRLAEDYLGPLIGGYATLTLEGFPTDGGSIPRAAWRIVGHPWQLPCLAYFIPHDSDYAARLWHRNVADTRLLQGMNLDGHVVAVKRLAVYRAVRDFGGIPWARHTEAGIAEARRFCRIVGEEEWHALAGRAERGSRQ